MFKCIPRKVKVDKSLGRAPSYHTKCRCPRCKDRLTWQYQSYCNSCGQRLKWRNVKRIN